MSRIALEKKLNVSGTCPQGDHPDATATRRKTSIRPLRVRIFPAILRRIQKAGLSLEPYFVVRECVTSEIRQITDSNLRFGFLVDEEFDALVEFEHTEDRHTLQSWIDDDKRCFGVWDGARLTATMWCDFREFSFEPNYRLLEDDEVYLFAAYSHPDYRGQGLAPNMRLRCYEALRALGRSRFYSYTEYFNVAARRFKDKLGARTESLHLHICLFGRWSRTLTLRKYR